jgi:opacity protein-like surface antigen
MKRRVNYLALAALLLATAASAFADVRVPDKEKNRPPKAQPFTALMMIDPNTKSTEARLLIPREVLQQMRAGLDGEDSRAAALAFFNTSGAQTVMAGLFLSLALAFGGVWLVRSRGQKRLGPAALCVAALALCGAAATAAYANAGPPSVARSLTSKILIPDAKWYGVYGQVKVEVVDDDNQIKLVLPRPQDDQPR